MPGHGPLPEEEEQGEIVRPGIRSIDRAATSCNHGIYGDSQDLPDTQSLAE